MVSRLYCAHSAEHSPETKESRPDFPTEGGVGVPGAKVHFSVMHVVHPREGDENHAEAHNAHATSTDSEDAGIDELMHHTDAMLRDDNAQLDQVFHTTTFQCLDYDFHIKC